MPITFSHWEREKKKSHAFVLYYYSLVCRFILQAELCLNSLHISNLLSMFHVIRVKTTYLSGEIRHSVAHSPWKKETDTDTKPQETLSYWQNIAISQAYTVTKCPLFLDIACRHAAEVFSSTCSCQSHFLKTIRDTRVYLTKKSCKAINKTKCVKAYHVRLYTSHCLKVPFPYETCLLHLSAIGTEWWLEYQYVQ